MRRPALLLAAALAVAAVGCGEFKRMAEDMFAITRCARDRGTTNSIGIHLRAQKTFQIELTNSPLDTLSDSLRLAAAKRVAECVRDDYHRFAELNAVQVLFSQGKNAGPLKVTASSAGYTFTRAQLGTPAPASPDSGAAAPKPSR